MERTHFRLHPGERVRTPRILLTYWKGHTLESNAGFRQLIYRHYTATRSGRKLLDRYRQVRHLLIGAWYPLMGYSRDLADWMAEQYHRPDLDEGMVLVFRRAESPYPVAELCLRGLHAGGRYEISSDRTAKRVERTGAELMQRIEITLPQRHSSDLIVYRRVQE